MAGAQNPDLPPAMPAKNVEDVLLAPRGEPRRREAHRAAEVDDLLLGASSYAGDGDRLGWRGRRRRVDGTLRVLQAHRGRLEQRPEVGAQKAIVGVESPAKAREGAQAPTQGFLGLGGSEPVGLVEQSNAAEHQREPVEGIE